MLAIKKYGGTSLAQASLIKRVASHTALAVSRGQKVVLVVSAMAGETNRLIALAQEMAPGARGLDYALLLSSGEQISAALTALALNELGLEAVAMSGQEAGIITDDVYQRARIKAINPEGLKKALDSGKVPVVMGFQGVNSRGELTILDRGGSDDTAVWAAHGLKADLCEIYTDVLGVYTTDPNICPKARIINSLSFEETMEMAATGAKVLQLHSVENAARLGVKIAVKHAHIEGEGTLIVSGERPQRKLTGIAFRKNNYRVALSNLPKSPAFYRELFDPLRRMHIEVDMLAKNFCQNGEAGLSFILGGEDYPLARELLDETLREHSKTVLNAQTDLARLSVVGEAAGKDPNLALKIYNHFNKLNTPIHGISATEMALTMLIDEKKLINAVNELHSLLGLDISETPV